MLDILVKAGCRAWQVLPLGPTGYGDSPYASSSSFAGNELLIDPRQIPYTSPTELTALNARLPHGGRVDYALVSSRKKDFLFKAAGAFLSLASRSELAQFKGFCEERAWWLDDYSLYRAITDDLGDGRWGLWPQGLRLREQKALEEARKRLSSQIEAYKALQYFFFEQWHGLKSYANSIGLTVIGDVPIFVSAESADAWSEPRLFKIDAKGHLAGLSGVPPDAFSSTGQLWGNPLYSWAEHEKDDFAWWKKRLRSCLALTDVVRIDHFRGFEACWEVSPEETTAINGRWVKGPGIKIFESLKREFGSKLRIIAEDLGVITDEVEALRDQTGFAGMRILQFAFALKDGKLDATNVYLPHNYIQNCVAYTGTHDNNTSRGWFASLDPATQDAVRRYLQCPDHEVVWQMIRALWSSCADLAIIPMQDLAGLGEEARMNLPSTVGSSNWSWRMDEGSIEPWMIERLRSFSELYGRLS